MNFIYLDLKGVGEYNFAIMFVDEVLHESMFWQK